MGLLSESGCGTSYQGPSWLRGPGGIATPAENTAAVPSAIAAIDSTIDSANHLFVRTIARDEVEKYVKVRRAARLAEAQAQLDMLAIEKPDSAQT